MKIRIGQIGLGTVGKGVVELLDKNHDFFKREFGLDLEIHSLCSISSEELQKFSDKASNITTDANSVTKDPAVDILIEVAGGYDLPRQWITQALNNGKHVVTANKALLAKYGSELFPLATEKNLCLQFEAAVGGGIPVIRSLQEGLVADDILGLACIINGTCNYILSEMSSKQSSFEVVLKEAQRLGYAEADPSFDVDGIDAVHKVSLLASLISAKYVPYESLLVEGIRHISALDISTAHELGYVIKLLGVVEQRPDGRILACVYPAILKKSHLLGNVNGVTNAVFLKTSEVGPILLTGAGAGKSATASAIVGDIVSIARRMLSKDPKPLPMGYFREDRKAILVPVEELETEFYIRLMAIDKPGILGKVTTILGECGVSISALLQKPEHDPDSTPIIILTHQCKNAQINQALERITALQILCAPAQLLRFYL